MKKILPFFFILLLLLLFFFRPWFHWLLFFFYKHYLFTLILLFLILLWGGLLFRFLIQWKENDKEKFQIGAFSILLTALALLLMILYPIFYSTLLKNSLVQSVDYLPVKTLENSTAFRYLPLPVVERISRDRYQEPTHRLLDYQPLIIQDRFAWVTPRTPDGFINTWRLRASGLMIINDDGSTRLIDETIQYTEGQRMHQNIRWQLLKDHYFIELPEFMYIPDGDTLYLVAPYLKWRLGFPVRTPELAGVYVVDPEGNKEHYTPEEAQKLPFIQRIVPEYLARLYAKSYALHKGILNYLFFHEDQVELIDIGPHNQQPYLLPTEKGLMWFTATEPYGEAYGVFKIFITDSLTGETQILELDIDSMLLGPQRSISYVRRKNPEISWYEEGTKTGTFVILEPRPLIIDENLYWLTSITTRDHAEISYTALVNASTREVIRIPSLQELIRILQEGEMKKEYELDILEGKERALKILEELEEDQRLLQDKINQLRRLIEDL